MAPKVLIIIFFTLSFSASSQLSTNIVMNAANNNTTFNTCLGGLYDSGGTGANAPYQNNESYTVTICPNVPGDFMTLQWTVFNLNGTNTSTAPNQTNADNITIYDGDDILAPTLGTYYAGDLTPGDLFGATPSNPTGCLTIVFNSNDVGTGDFNAQVTCETPCDPPSANATILNSDNLSGDSIAVCVDEMISFQDNGSTAGPSGLFTLQKWVWSWGDGTPNDTLLSGASLSHSFSNPGQYIVQLTVIDDNNCVNLNATDLNVFVSTYPTFVPFPGDTTLCLGQSVELAAAPDNYEQTWSGFPAQIYDATNCMEDLTGIVQATTLVLTGFDPNVSLNNANPDVLSICVEMEHSFMGDFVLQVQCPTGQIMTLHQQGGGGVNLGNPVQGIIDCNDPATFGSPWTYCFDAVATDTWVQAVAAVTTIPNGGGGNSLVPGNYAPVDPMGFAALDGCPINGTWNLLFTDLWASDDGSLPGWSINFDPSLYPPATVFTPNIGSNSDSSYWSLNDPFIISNSPDLDTIIVTPTSAGVFNYTYTVSNNFGCTFDSTISITVNASPPPNITFIDDYIFACINQNNVNIAVDSIGGAFDPTAITYSWSPIPGNQDNINVTPTNVNNWYYLTVFDGCNSATDSVQVEIGIVEVDSISILPALGCAGQGTSSGSISVYPMAANWTYTLVGNGMVTGPQTSNVFNDLVGNLTYNLLATNPQGCILDTNIIVPQANATLNATLDPNALKNTLCFGSADGEAGIINIMGGINTPTAGPFNVTWTHADGTNVIGGQNIQLNGGDIVNTLYAGNWQVLVEEQNSGCAWSQTFTIGEADLLTTSVVSSDSICNGTATGSMNVFGYGGTGNYTVSVVDNLGNLVSTPGTSVAVGLAPGQYFYTLNDENGCEASGITSIVSRGEIMITFDQVNILCYGSDKGFVSITGAQNYAGSYNDLQFIWTPSITGGDGPGKIFESGMPPGTYVIEFQDTQGCISDTILTILDAEPIVLEIDKKSTFCRIAGFQNGNGYLKVFPSGGAGNYSLLWENLQTGETSNVVQWGALNPGDYKISVLDNNNCLVTDTVTLDSVNVVADFTITSDDFEGQGALEGTEPINVKFQNNSVGFSDVTNPESDTVFSWNYDVKSIPGADWFFSYNYNEVLDTTYTGEGVFQVCLIAKNYNDCGDTQCVDITVHRQPQLLLPNVFTPGSEPNNTFFFPNVGIKEFKATVYNRYGVKVFEFMDITDHWDGTNIKNNKPCSDGAYFYVFKGESNNGIPYSGEGNITLIRGK
ncbi:MAG: gliding motility-associated C-terminal domain-containing protein [Crocinitomicaceae bacterium]